MKHLSCAVLIWLFTLVPSQISYTQTLWQHDTLKLHTRWSTEISPTNTLNEYPRPQLFRKEWKNLNGLWYYLIADSSLSTPEKYQDKILVPFPIESSLSGVKKPLSTNQYLWYKTAFEYELRKNNERILLHFGAVDYKCWVYANSKEIGSHEGGYTEFSFDITDALKKGTNELVVKVYDPSDAGIGPRGKQVLNPHGIYYTPSSGIWQTVWLETVPERYISAVTITPDIDKSTVNVKVHSASQHSIVINVDGKIVKSRSNSNISIPIERVKLWSPENPYLYDINISMGKDRVSSYFGMRKVEVKKDADGYDRIFLNNRPYFNLGTLDQGFWPDGIYTAPTDEALAFDIKAIKAMGFNTIRKHIKVEPARWYYHCDKLGMLVWQDFVQPNPSLPAGAKAAFEKQGNEMMEQLYNHPCITTWVLFNEKWGSYDQQRLTEWIKSKDPTRLVNGHSGEILYVNEKLRSPSPNAYISSDIADIHSYPDPMNAMTLPGKAKVLGEFGGIGVFIPGHQWNVNSAWGYINVTPAALKEKYRIMNQHLQLLKKEGLSASIYTQPFDVEGEQNGLMTYDREVIKIPFEELRKIHSPLNPAMGIIPKVEAKNADVTEPVQLYANAVQQYLDGKKDIDFLKNLAEMAAQTGDAAGRNRFSKEYIASLNKPYSEDNISFIENNTKKVSDIGFPILLEHEKTINGKEQRTLHVKLMNIIYQDVVAAYVPNADSKPNWDEVFEKIKPYGAPGEEIYLRAKTIHTMNQQDWSTYKSCAKEYIERYGAWLKPEEKKMFEEKLQQR